jgi:anti-sigma regulatory factor (Ser/Thr protein kinase)
MPATLPFDPNPAAPSVARRFVRETIDAAGVEVDVDMALLLTSELVTNAVQHTGQRGTLRVCCNPTFRIEVTDERPDLPVPTPAHAARAATAAAAGMSSADGESGRGLLFLDSLASRWGCETDGATKTVWFEL